MNVTIGTCGNCGGRVSVLREWSGTQPQAPSCEVCGLRAKPYYGPTIEMERPNQHARALSGPFDAFSAAAAEENQRRDAIRAFEALDRIDEDLQRMDAPYKPWRMRNAR
jgi:hypothetical protein